MRHSTSCPSKQIVMKVESYQKNILPLTRRRTHQTRHYKRAPSMVPADLNAVLKEFTLLPKPFNALTNRQNSMNDGCGFPTDDGCFFPVDPLEKEGLFLPSMSDTSTHDDNPVITLAPRHIHNDHSLQTSVAHSSFGTYHSDCDHSDERLLASTPKPIRRAPVTPEGPRKSRKRHEFVDFDIASAPDFIFLPEDV